MELRPSPGLKHDHERSWTRRDVLRAALIAGVALPAGGSLLAACGGDDDDPTATVAGAQASGTAAVAEPTTMEPGTATVAPEATMGGEEPTVSGDVTELYGVPVEPALNEGGIVIWGTHGYLWSESSLFYADVGPIFEAPVQVHPETFEPAPLLVASWETSDDASLWTFTIQEGVTFQDGEPMDAEDIAFQINLLKAVGFAEPPLNSPVVSVPDAQTVELAFETTTLDVAYGLRFHPIYPAHVLGEDFDLEDDDALATLYESGGIFSDDPSRVIGTGPFRYAEAASGDFDRLVRYDGYWRGKPHLDELVIRKLASTDLYPSLINTGDIDIAGVGRYTLLDPSQVEQFDPDIVRLVEYVNDSIFNLQFNLIPDVPFFQDARVRQALLYATDREALVEAVFYGYGAVPLTTYALPGYYHEDGITAVYPFDPEAANALLDEAGFLMGDDGVRQNGDVRLAFRLLFDTGTASHVTTAAILQEQWRAVGAAVELVGLETTALTEAYEQHDFDTTLGVWGTTPDQRFFFECREAPDYINAGYCNEELDALMDASMTELDPEARMELNTQVLNLILEDLPILPLVQMGGLAAVNKRVHNVHPYAFNNFAFNAETWWVDA
jgi:peptide/nickel transport system substrate-binding protein